MARMGPPNILSLILLLEVAANAFLTPRRSCGARPVSPFFGDHAADGTRARRAAAPAATLQGREDGAVQSPGYIGEDYTDYRCGFVSIIGAPNMGKSTVLNALVEENLCIATPRPQTTRHAILGLLTTEHCQVCLFDTPGVIGDPAYRLQEGMMEAVVGAFRDADVLMVVTDLFSTPIPDDALFRKIQASHKPTIVCVNKVDLVGQVNVTAETSAEKTMTVEQAVLFWRHLLPQALVVLPMSAANGPADPGVVALRRILTGGDDVPAALRALGRPIAGMYRDGEQFVTDDEARQLLPPSPPLYDTDILTDRPERFIASETIRAALFELLKKEVPYCCEVQINSFKEPSGSSAKPVLRIDASVIVERDSQKGIVVGKGGEKIKMLGIRARSKLEEFFQKQVLDSVGALRLLKVYLNLSVKVVKDWRKSEDKLKSFGYIP